VEGVPRAEPLTRGVKGEGRREKGERALRLSALRAPRSDLNEVIAHLRQFNATGEFP
jgi:hypothetical protein